MVESFFKSDENTKGLYIDANNLYGYGIIHCLPYGGFKTFIEFGQTFLGTILITPGDSDLGFVLEVDLIYPDNIEEKTK